MVVIQTPKDGILITKGHKWQCERPSFTSRNTAFYKLLAINKLHIWHKRRGTSDSDITPEHPDEYRHGATTKRSFVLEITAY